VHIQDHLAFVERSWETPVPIFIVIGESIRQTRSLGAYAYGFFGDILESGEPQEAPYLRVVMAGAHSSITMLEVKRGFGSNGKLLLMVLYA